MSLITFFTDCGQTLVCPVVFAIRIDMPAFRALPRAWFAFVVGMTMRSRIKAFITLAEPLLFFEGRIERAVSAGHWHGFVVPLADVTPFLTLDALAIYRSEPFTTLSTQTEVFLRDISYENKFVSAAVTGVTVGASGATLSAINTGSSLVIKEFACLAQTFRRVEHTMLTRISPRVIIVPFLALWAPGRLTSGISFD